MSAPGSSRPCCAIEVDGGMRPRQEFAPHLLIGRHRLDGGVVLVGAHQIAAVGAGGAQHRVEVLEDARGLLLALGQPACGTRSASTSGAMPLTKSCAIRPVANTQRPAFMPCANLTCPAPSSTGSSGSPLRLHSCRSSRPSSLHCGRSVADFGIGRTLGRCGAAARAGTSAWLACPAFNSAEHNSPETGATHDDRPRLWLLCSARSSSARSAAAAQAQNYPNRAITIVVPFAAGGLTDVPARVFAAMLQEKIGQNVVVENKTGGIRHDRRRVCGRARRRTAIRCSPIRSPTRRTCTTSRCPTTRSTTSRMIGMDRRGAAAGAHHQRQAAVQDAGRAGRRREGRSEEDQLRHLRSGHLAGDRADAAQCARQDRDRRRAVSRLRRGGAQRRGRRHPGRLRVLLAGQAAGRRRQGARARGREPARIADLARRADHGGAGLPNFDFRGFVGLAAPAKTPTPIIAYLNKQLNDVVQSELFKKRMARSA